MSAMGSRCCCVAVLSYYLSYSLPSALVLNTIAAPLVVSSNPHYFKDAKGRALILAGSQTWNTLQDWGSDGSPRALDFNAFVKFLTAHGQNFTLLWRVEMPKFCSLPSTASSPPDFTVSPQPWQRTGPGKATDGGLKFDLTRFDQGYFDRLRARTQALNDAGIYAGIYLFTGEFLNIFRCPSDGYPFTGANNINGIDDGYISGPKGMASMTMTAPNAMTRFQDAYVEKVIDTLNDLPNVLWIVSEEAPAIPSGGTTIRLLTSENMRRKAAPTPDRVGRADPFRSGHRWDPLQLQCGLGGPGQYHFAHLLLRKRNAGLQGKHQRQRPFLLRSSVEGHSPAESQLHMEELCQRQPGAVHGPLPAVLSAREQEHVCLANQRNMLRSRPALGQPEGQSRVHDPIFPQDEPGQSDTAAGSQFDRLLSGPNSIRRRGVPGVRSFRRFVYGRPVGYAGIEEVEGGVVQPGDRGRRWPQLRFTRAPRPSASPPRSTAMRCSTWWTPRDTQTITEAKQTTFAEIPDTHPGAAGRHGRHGSQPQEDGGFLCGRTNPVAPTL